MVGHRRTSLLSCFALGLVWAAPAWAEAPGWADPGWRETSSHYDVSFDRAGLSTTIRDFELKALDRDGARAIALRIIPYDSAFENLDVEDLVTVKSDGRVIPVDARAVKDQPASTDVTSPYFDERRVKIVAFPGVAPGDSVKGRYRLTGRRARLPGAFADHWTQAADAPPGTMTLTVAGPADMPLHVSARDVEDLAEVVGDRVVHHVTFTQVEPRLSRSPAYPFDDARRFEASTFADYADFAAAIRARNAPMAVPDTAVAKLAAEVVGDAATDRVRAERLHGWVASTIRYVGIGLDDGGWTSQPAAAVLSAGYGDCKAHAVLLKSLLAAVGITADLVVLNAGPQYTLTDVATPNFDHAIVYVPALAIYLDPTADSIAFGSLPPSLYGKPALDIDRGQLTTIPVMAPGDFALTSETDYILLPDGTRRASSRFIGTGLGSSLGRGVAQWIAGQDRSVLAASDLSDAGLAGSGTYSFPDPHRASPSFDLTAPFTITQALDLDSPFTIRMLPLTDPRPGSVRLVMGNVQQGDFACSAIDTRSIAYLALPDGINLSEKPADIRSIVEIEGTTSRGPVTGRIEIDGRVWLEGRTVRSRSRLAMAFSAPVCPESFAQRIKDAAGTVDAFTHGGISLTPFAVSFVTDEGSRFAVGLEAYQAHLYDKAFLLWFSLAEGGHSEAQNEIGALYEAGLGVRQDPGEAFRWYLKSAAQGNPFGQSHLAYCYRMGLGVARDDGRAAFWYDRSAAQGFAYAEYNLAEMHVQGLIYPADMPLALSLLERSSAHGYAAADSRLGWIFQSGNGAPRDVRQAMDRYGRAAAKGEAYADAQLGDIYALGEGVPVDYARAAYHLRRAADKGFARAQFELGWIYENGFGVPASRDDAMAWYTKAARLGHAEAQSRLDLLREQANPSLWSKVVRLISRRG